MSKEAIIGNSTIGEGHPTYIIGEIGINHNGILSIAKQLMLAAKKSRSERGQVPEAHSRDLRAQRAAVPDARHPPWGYIPYLEYRYKVEFDREAYQEIDSYAKELGIDWFASSWDIPSLEFMESFNPVAHKIPSALLTDKELLRAHRDTGRPLILSTGMSTMEQIREAIDILGEDRLVLCHTTSSYPCPPEELNLRMIQTLKENFNCPIGYSGHEVGLVTTAVAVAMGATLVERHITLDRAMWGGSDQSASVEPQGSPHWSNTSV